VRRRCLIRLSEGIDVFAVLAAALLAKLLCRSWPAK
jgi:hypothetical protein